jgi:ribonuclease-3
MRAALAELFGIPEDAPHFVQALTHPSFANEQGDGSDNQRLEFLGDAVLEFCCSELLYQRFPQADEGALTRMRARLVNADALGDFARAHALAPALLLGRGADSSGLRESTNVLADAVEALIAATYLDVGLDAARAACSRVVERGLAELAVHGERDAKSELQERVQAQGHPPPTYEVVDSGGPDHERWFEVSARLGDQDLGRGRGRSKRQAEFAAARVALEQRAWQAEEPS